MFYVYIIKSEIDSKLYIGYTDNLRRRISEHKKKKVKSTKYRGKMKLIYYEAYRCLKDAMTREQNLKYFGKAYAQLKKRIRNSINE
jgi:putative endonuclease